MPNRPQRASDKPILNPCLTRVAPTGHRSARGFTLIEVLLATVLLAAGLALAFATLRASTATAQRGEVAP